MLSPLENTILIPVATPHSSQWSQKATITVKHKYFVKYNLNGGGGGYHLMLVRIEFSSLLGRCSTVLSCLASGDAGTHQIT